jgi:hypothetical protein
MELTHQYLQPQLQIILLYNRIYCVEKGKSPMYTIGCVLFERRGAGRIRSNPDRRTTHLKMIEAQPGQSAQCKRVDHEQLDGFHSPRPPLVVKDVHQAVSDLNDINVAGDRVSCRERERNVEVEFLSVTLDTPARPYP